MTRLLMQIETKDDGVYEVNPDYVQLIKDNRAGGSYVYLAEWEEAVESSNSVAALKDRWLAAQNYGAPA